MYLGHFYWFVVWYYSHWWHLLPASDSANWIHTVKILVFRTCKIQSTVYATNSAFQLHGMSKFSHFHQPISSFWPVGHYKLHDSSIYGGRGHHKGIEQQKKKKKNFPMPTSLWSVFIANESVVHMSTCLYQYARYWWHELLWDVPCVLKQDLDTVFLLILTKSSGFRDQQEGYWLLSALYQFCCVEWLRLWYVQAGTAC